MPKTFETKYPETICIIDATEIKSRHAIINDVVTNIFKLQRNKYFERFNFICITVIHWK